MKVGVFAFFYFDAAEATTGATYSGKYYCVFLRASLVVPISFRNRWICPW